MISATSATSATGAAGAGGATTPAEAQPPATASVQPSAYTPPDPKQRAQELLEESQRILDEALQQLRAGEFATSSDAIGRASNRIGNALYFLRIATRQ